jgi:hypothetical protein
MEISGYLLGIIVSVGSLAVCCRFDVILQFHSRQNTFKEL